MAYKLLLSIIMLINVQVCDAAEITSLTAARLYPFSDIDRALFYNEITQKMESPYSTESVELFSATRLVTIEKSAFTQLHTHALNRSKAVETAALQAHERYIIIRSDVEFLGKRVKVAQEQQLKLQNVKVQEDPEIKRNVHLSQQDLMRLLQWSHGIETVWLGMQGDRGDVGSFLIDIFLGTTKLEAPKLLMQFIMLAHPHEQEKRSRYFGYH